MTSSPLLGGTHSTISGAILAVADHLAHGTRRDDSTRLSLHMQRRLYRRWKPLDYPDKPADWTLMGAPSQFPMMVLWMTPDTITFNAAILADGG